MNLRNNNEQTLNYFLELLNIPYTQARGRRHGYGHYDHGHSSFMRAMATNGFGHSIDIDFSALQLELNMMKALKAKGSIPQFDSLLTLVQALLDKPPEVRMLFPETVKLANLLLVVPASSATAERSFSCLRRLKTWLNSTTTQARLNSIAILNCYREIQPDISNVMTDFVGLNDFRRKTFGNL
jgi:hypothetical protein